MSASDDPVDAVDLAPTRDPRPAVRRPLLAIMATTALIVWAADQFTKHLAVTRLVPNDPVTVIDGWLQWRLVRNPYAAFSLSPGRTWILTIVASVVVMVIIFASRRLGHPGWALAMGFLLGGAVGNLTDRLFREPGFGSGHVVDFIEFLKFPVTDFPVFNVADSSIVIAASLIVLLSLRGVAFEAPAVPSISDSSVGSDRDA